MVVISMIYMLTLSDDGQWHIDTLVGVDLPPTVAQPTMRAMPIQKNFDVNLVSNLAINLIPGQTRTISIIPRLRTVNASAYDGVRFRGYTGRITTHLTTVTP